MPQARPNTSLFDLQALCPEDGPPLPVAGDVCRAAKLQSLSAFPYLYITVLLGVLLNGVDMGVGRGVGGYSVH